MVLHSPIQSAPPVLLPSVEQREQHLLEDHYINLEIAFRKRQLSWQFKAQQAMKRGLDVFGALFGLTVLFLPLFLIALAVKVTSRGPVFYKSTRTGLKKTPFEMWKFRTMVLDADKQLARLRTQHNKQGELFKLKQDPRFTSIGGFLRKYSLDEFPQLLNVLRGDMSLVGPRPFIPDESAYYEWPYTLRFEVKPGMTGYHQANGRSNISFQQICDMELHYVENWSLWFDLTILLQTLPAVLFKKGAC